MDHPMSDAEPAIGPLWIRRQVFEHSVAVPLLTTSNASQIDFSRLAAELVAASVVPPPAPPAVTYDAWVAAAGLHARLDSSEHAAIIIEALETNAREAFIRCNDPAKLTAATSHLAHRDLLIPVPELLAFVKLHAAATVSARFRQTADAVWPEDRTPAGAPTTPNPPATTTTNASATASATANATAPANTPSTSAPSSNPTPATPTTPTKTAPTGASPAKTTTTATATTSSSSTTTTTTTDSKNNPNSNKNTTATPVSPVAPSRNSAQRQSAAPSSPSLFSSFPHHLTPLSLTPSSPRFHQPASASPANSSSTHPQTSQPSATAATTPPHNSPNTSTSPSPHPTNKTTSTSSSQSPPHPSAPVSPQPPSSDSPVRKKNSTPVQAIKSHQSAIIAAAQHAFERETRLVISTMKPLLLTVASAYSVGLDYVANMPTTPAAPTMSDSRGTVAVESGSLARDGFLDKARLTANHVGQSASTPITASGSNNAGVSATTTTNPNTVSSADAGAGTFAASATNEADTVMADETTAQKSSSQPQRKGPPITRAMLEHLSFLLTTTCDSAGRSRPVSWVVPQWRDPDRTNTIPLCELVDILTTALSRVPLLEADYAGGGGDGTTASGSDSGSGGAVDRNDVDNKGNCIDVTEIRDLEKRTIVRSDMRRRDNGITSSQTKLVEIVGENRGLIFAPYNAAYAKEKIAKHVAEVGVDLDANVWDKFYRPAHRVASQERGDPDLTAAVACVLQPERFLPFAVPVRDENRWRYDGQPVQPNEIGGGKDKAAPSPALFAVTVPLPTAYEEQLRARCREISQLRQEVLSVEPRPVDTKSAVGAQQDKGEGDVTMADKDEVGRAIQSHVQEKFREWLNHSGRIRQLSDLVRLEQDA